MGSEILLQPDRSEMRKILVLFINQINFNNYFCRFDHCRGSSTNMFNDFRTCMEMCEQPAIQAQERGWGIKIKENLEKEKIVSNFSMPKDDNTTECQPNPCKNDARCEPRDNRKYHCYCRTGYGGKDCSIGPRK